MGDGRWAMGDGRWAMGDGPIQAMLSHDAREHGVWLIGNALPAATEDPDRAGLNTYPSPQGALQDDRCAAKRSDVPL